MRSEIRDIQRRLGITTVFVTHDQVEALSMCDRVAVMEGGKLVQFGTPFEIYERPRHPFIADFVGRTNKLKGTVGDRRLRGGRAAHLARRRDARERLSRCW